MLDPPASWQHNYRSLVITVKPGRVPPNMVISKQSDNHRHASSQKSLKMLTVETIEVHSALWIIHSTSTPFRNETVKAIEREREPAHNDDTGRSNWIREVM